MIWMLTQNEQILVKTKIFSTAFKKYIFENIIFNFPQVCERTQLRSQLWGRLVLSFNILFGLLILIYWNKPNSLLLL